MIALADHLDLDRFVVGGISLGAGTALNLAVRYPDRVTALVLCRPAWLDRPQAEFNRQAYAEIADLLDRYPAETAAAHYPQTRHLPDRSQHLARRQRHPCSASSPAHGQPRTRSPARLPEFQPDRLSTDTWRAIDVPTLVIGHHDDPFHPYEIAQAHVDTIPGATLCTVPSKDADPARFAAEIQVALHDFLRPL